MNEMTSALSKYRPLQIEAAAESTGILKSDVKSLLAAIEAREETPEILISAAIPQEIFAVDPRLAELQLKEMVVLWLAKLSKIVEREDQLLDNIKYAIRALKIDCQLSGDVESWDMLQLADTGARLNKFFITPDGTKFQFNDDHIYWENGDITYSIDSEGYPADAEGNRINGEFA